MNNSCSIVLRSCYLPGCNHPYSLASRSAVCMVIGSAPRALLYTTRRRKCLIRHTLTQHPSGLPRTLDVLINDVGDVPRAYAIRLANATDISVLQQESDCKSSNPSDTVHISLEWALNRREFRRPILMKTLAGSEHSKRRQPFTHSLCVWLRPSKCVVQFDDHSLTLQSYTERVCLFDSVNKRLLMVGQHIRDCLPSKSFCDRSGECLCVS